MVFTKSVMPAGTGSAAGGSGAQGGRTTFRPPWVKDQPPPVPMPSAPWTLKHKENAAQKQTEDAPVRKTSTIKITPSQPKENGTTVTQPRLQSREVKVPVQKETPVPIQRETTVPIKKETTVPIKRETTVPIKREDNKPSLTTQKTIRDDRSPVKNNTGPTENNVPVRRERPPPVAPNDVAKTQARETIDKVIPKQQTLTKQNSAARIPAPPPMAPPMPPPAPKMLGADHKPLSSKQQKIIDQLKSRPRKRPDWACMMKEVEEGKKLKHVVCNDRSQPLLPSKHSKTKDGSFVYESEKANLHNQLLKQIQSGVKLKTVQTNDRSRPNLDGVKKFRRQMTIEEQIQKSQSVAAMPEEEIADEIDELDDIDTVRDELQSSKQLLALELREKEAQIRENKCLLARIKNLESELERERGKAAASSTRSVMEERMKDEEIVVKLKQEADEARKMAKEMEKKYLKVTDELDTIQGQLEEARKQNEMLELKLVGISKSESRRDSRRDSQAPDGEEDEEEDITDSEDDDDDGEDTEEKREKRAKRELKLMMNKLRNFKDKETNARKERSSLKDQMKQQQELIKEESKKFKILQREVDKMAAMMNQVDDEDEEKEANLEENEEEEEEVSEEESETESESESSSESDEEEASASEPEDAPIDKRKENYTSRTRKHESCLAALKKGNYLLKANIDRLKDDLNKQRVKTTQLQQDLDSVLSELG